MKKLGPLHRTEASQEHTRLPGSAFFAGQGDLRQLLDGQTRFESSHGTLAGEHLQVGIPHLAHQTSGYAFGGRAQGGERDRREGQEGSAP